MARRKPRRGNNPRSRSNKGNVDQEESEVEFVRDSEVERQCAAIVALRDVEIEQLRATIRFLRRSYFSQEQLQTPLLQFFEENLPNLTLPDGQHEPDWKIEEANLSLDHPAANQFMQASLLHRLSTAHPSYSAAISSFRGFKFSAKSGLPGADKLQTTYPAWDGYSNSKITGLKDMLQTPNAINSHRLSVGVTPNTRRLPKYGEMLMSVRGSPLGVYKEEDTTTMETIQEAEDV
ncbi:hypothetical protein M569_12932 [Genlisea aurea]|uniref:Uncharacterized protein n=1 Tax=Genlisea aurea TaxID=192259 RepID=S8DQ45_9LAMI|nr:hypothetical protein M569_12932 [Genlisea aurea]